MVLENISIDDVIQTFPPEISASLSILIRILQALGIIFIVYLTFLVLNIILNIRRLRIIKKTFKKVQEMDEKLDLLLKSKELKLKENSVKKPEKKKK